jgi:hypothetical protein
MAALAAQSPWRHPCASLCGSESRMTAATLHGRCCGLVVAVGTTSGPNAFRTARRAPVRTVQHSESCRPPPPKAACACAYRSGGRYHRSTALSLTLALLRVRVSKRAAAHLVGADVAAARDECAAAQRRCDLRVRFGARSRPQRSVAGCRVRPAHTPKRRVASSVRQKRPHGSMPTRLHAIAAGTRRRRRASTARGSRRPPSSWPAGAVLRDGSGAFRTPTGTAATSQPRAPCRDGCRRQPFPCRTPARRSHRDGPDAHRR